MTANKANDQGVCANSDPDSLAFTCGKYHVVAIVDVEVTNATSATEAEKLVQEWLHAGAEGRVVKGVRAIAKADLS